jgi:phosphatidate phosphatase APP1
MSDWRSVLVHVVDDVESAMDRLKYRLAYALGGPDPIKIVPYRGYGTAERLYVHGRVLEEQGITAATDSDTVWQNLLNMYKRIESDEVPFARLIAHFQGADYGVVADEEGMFELWITPQRPLSRHSLWQQVELELVEPQSSKQEGPVRATAEVLVPPDSAQLAVISDIDDTVLQSGVGNLLLMARNVFLGNAHTRLPFPGVAAFYRALFGGPDGRTMNPLFYVSSSPWNLYDLLSQFFHLQHIPVGPVLLLRNWGISEEELLPTRNRQFKLRMVEQILETYLELPFLLIGDSRQEDPEIYAEVVRRYPGHIAVVYVRNVSRGPRRPEAIAALAQDVVEQDSALVLAEDTLSMARHAAERGWIRPEALDGIQEERERDEGPPGLIERLVGEEEGPGPLTISGRSPGPAGQG